MAIEVLIKAIKVVKKAEVPAWEQLATFSEQCPALAGAIAQREHTLRR